MNDDAMTLPYGDLPAALADRIDRKSAILSLCAQAIVKLLPTYEENLARLNRFIELARTVLNQRESCRQPV